MLCRFVLRDDISPASRTRMILILNFYGPSKKSMIKTLLITGRNTTHTYCNFFSHHINMIKIKMTNRQNKESPASLSLKGQVTQHASVKWPTESKLHSLKQLTREIPDWGKTRMH